MRTTLNIEDKIFIVIKSLARQRGETIGKIVSELLSKALTPTDNIEMRNGVPIIAHQEDSSETVTMDLVNQLRDETP